MVESRLAMGNVRDPIPASPLKVAIDVPDTTSILDPLPHRPNNNHRPPEDTSLLRTETEGKRYRRLLRRPAFDSPPVATHRLLCRIVWYHGPVRRLPGHNRGIRPEHPRRRAVYRRPSRSRGAGPAERRVARIEDEDALDS